MNKFAISFKILMSLSVLINSFAYTQRFVPL